MELTNDFRVSVPIQDAWNLFTDIERIAPLLPGAQLQEVEGDEYRGTVKVKVGPIIVEYRGTATFIERDEAAGRVVLKAAGRDTRGQGNATATITATITPDGDATSVLVVTDLSVTGRVAQFGRGVLADVSSRLMGQFVNSLEADLAAGGPPNPDVADRGPPQSFSDAPAAYTPGRGQGASAVGSGAGGDIAEIPPLSRPRRINSPDATPVDLIGLTRVALTRRLLPVAAVIMMLVLVVLRHRRRHRMPGWRTSQEGT